MSHDLNKKQTLHLQFNQKLQQPQQLQPQQPQQLQPQQPQQLHPQQLQQLHQQLQPPQRRGSFLYRNESYETLQQQQQQQQQICMPAATTILPRNHPSTLSSCHSSVSASPTSIPEHLYPEEHLVTPFAQILQRLKGARNNYVDLNRLNEKRRRRSSNLYMDPSKETATTTAIANTLSPDSSKIHENSVLEILDDMDWCLDQLEAIQTHRSLGDHTSSKFKRILRRELEQLSESGRSGNQISEYISKTFLEKEEEAVTDIKADTNSVTQKRFSSTNTHFSTTTTTTTTSTTTTSTPTTTQKRTKMLSPTLSPTKRSISPCSSMSIIPLFHQESIDNNNNKNDSINNNNNSISSNDSSNKNENNQTKIKNITIIESNMKNNNNNSIKNNKIGTKNNSNNTTNNNNTNNKPNNDKTNSHPCISEERSFGIVGVDDNAIQKHLGSLDDWNLNVFQLDDLSNGHPLIVMGYSIFKQRELMVKFQIEPRTLLNYLSTIEKHYHLSHLYHNRSHAADVTNSVHVLLNKTPLLKVFSDVEILATLFASLIHDVDHPGLTNQHLINTNSDLALMYNDESILENHHLAVAFKLLQYPDCDIFQHFTEHSRKRIRINVINMVLATDMSKHMSLLAGLKTMVEARKVSGTGVLVFDEANDRLQVLKCLLHCADLANPTKHLDIYNGWIERVINEFHNQGDIERSLGLEISPMCDRNNASIEKSQVGFIDFVVQPLWEAWAELVEPFCDDILDTIDCNKTYYQALSITSPKSGEEKKGGVFVKEGNDKNNSRRNSLHFEFPRQEENLKNEVEGHDKVNRENILKNVHPVRITIEKSHSILQEE